LRKNNLRPDGEKTLQIDALKKFETDVFFNPLMNAYLERMPAQIALPRAALVPDREWYGSVSLLPNEAALAFEPPGLT
jgi:hypothetical protein